MPRACVIRCQVSIHPEDPCIRKVICARAWSADVRLDASSGIHAHARAYMLAFAHACQCAHADSGHGLAQNKLGTDGVGRSMGAVVLPAHIFSDPPRYVPISNICSA
jgi:hypothetical protein